MEASQGTVQVHGGVDRRWIIGILLLWATILLYFRPATPFEWDEVLYQRALDYYDVADHHPHPPGAPVFIAAGHVFKFFVGDPQLAMQLTTIVASVGCLLALYLLTLRLGRDPMAPFAALGILAVLPGYLFHSNVGLSDVPSATAMVAGVLACVVAWDDPRALPLAAGVVAFGLGIRPQDLPALVVIGVIAIASAVRRRAWARLAAALGVGVGVSAAVWVPAIWITGPARYFQAIKDHATYLKNVESYLYFPHMALEPTVRYWYINPFGTSELAIAFWLAVLLGAVSWWRAGRRRVVLVGAASGLLYLVLAPFGMNPLSSVRFVQPAMPFLALMASGVVVSPRRRLRVTATVAISVWGAMSLAWGWSVYRIRREPAPIWAGLTWVRDHMNPATTTVVYDGHFLVHTEYIFKGTAFTLEEKREGGVHSARERPGGHVVQVMGYPVPGCEVLFDRDWQSRKVLQMAFWRYGSCAVSSAPANLGPWFSPNWQIRPEGWQLWSTGQIQVAPDGPPLATSVCPTSYGVRVARAGQPEVAVDAGRCLDVPVFAGPAGAVIVKAPQSTHVLLKPMSFSDDPARLAALGVGATVSVVPVVARTEGAAGSFWQTDLVVANPTARALTVRFGFLPSGSDNAHVAPATAVLPGNSVLAVKDVLSRPEFGGAGGTGALVLETVVGRAGEEAGGIAVFARNYNVHASESQIRCGEGVPAVPAALGLIENQVATVSKVLLPASARVSVGAASLASEPVELAVGASSPEGSASVTLRLPPYGHVQERMNVPPGELKLTFVAHGGGVSARVFPYVAVVDGATGEPSHILVLPGTGTGTGTGSASGAGVGAPPLPWGSSSPSRRSGASAPGRPLESAVHTPGTERKEGRP